MSLRTPARRAERARAQADAVRARAELRAARIAARAQRRAEQDAQSAARPAGAGPWYAVALMGTGVSIDTSWKFFGRELHIDGMMWHAIPLERVAMFAVLETAMVACGWSMRASMQRSGKPGPAQPYAYALAAVSAYMAVAVSGPAAGPVRAVLGAGLALLGLHQALHIVARMRHGQSTGTLARIGRELRERALSRLGLADDSRDALARTRDRAAARAAWLASDVHGAPWARERRLLRALRIAGTDPVRLETMLELIAYAQHAGDLRTVQQPSPFRRYQPAMQGAPVQADVLRAVRSNFLAQMPTQPPFAQVGSVRPHPVRSAQASPMDSAHETRVRSVQRPARAPKPRTGHAGTTAPARAARTSEEHLARAREVRSAHPGISGRAVAKLVGISPTRLRQIEKKARQNAATN